MKQVRRRPVAVEPADPPVSVSDPSPDEKTERLSFALTKDGAVAVDQLRPATLDKLRKALNDPTARQAIFGSPVTDMSGWLAVASQATYLSGALVAAAVAKLGYGDDQARSFLLADKEIAMIAQPAAVGLQETFGSLESSWQASLGLALVSVYGPKVIALKKPATVTPLREVSKPDSDAS